MRPSDLPPGVSASHPMIAGEDEMTDLMEIFEGQLDLQVRTFGRHPADMNQGRLPGHHRACPPQALPCHLLSAEILPHNLVRTDHSHHKVLHLFL